MKKITILILLSVFLLSINSSLSVYANTALTFTVVSPEEPVQPGSNRVILPIRANNNPGFAAVGFMLTFDDEILEFVNLDNPRILPNIHNQPYTGNSPQWISLVNIATPSDWNGDILGELVFNVRASAQEGSSSHVTLAITTGRNGTPASMDGTLLSNPPMVPGSVRVGPQIDDPTVSPSPSPDPSPSPSPDPSPSPSPGTSPSPSPGPGDPGGPGGPGGPGTPGGPGGPGPGGPGTTPSPDPSPSPSPDVSPSPGPGTNGNGNNGNFGDVPKTGVPSITGTIAIMWLSIVITACLSTCLYYYIRTKRKSAGFSHRRMK
ncbi:MAG: hypothetical protein LBD23_16940 [Oscillospiraceae bacterium]|jgi:hypothetical protein|nr:hypothetical protein [Oscillospiraceae bacterium]